MKKRKYIAFLHVVLLFSFAMFGCTNNKKEEPKEKFYLAEPLVIETESQYRDRDAKVQIYKDNELVYEYNGAVEISRQSERYYVIIHTSSCSCFENGEVEDEERN